MGKVTYVAVSPRTRTRFNLGTNTDRVLLVDSAHTFTPVVRILRTGTAGRCRAWPSALPTKATYS